MFFATSATLRWYGAPLGEAFQLRDDLEDEGPGLAAEPDMSRIADLVSEAMSALASSRIGDPPADDLRAIASALGEP